ncbi:MAG: hypothetical protein FWG98_09955, partial [Candidatus Cloacimonetes bacterium]|nr:hypothetical protein [Candidatus Cloacimonadota bacterium]
EIYNIRGQKVKTLRTGFAQEGSDFTNAHSYNVTWNMRDENNRPVGAGVYFYRAVVDGEVIGTNRMVLIK